MIYFLLSVYGIVFECATSICKTLWGGQSNNHIQLMIKSYVSSQIKKEEEDIKKFSFLVDEFQKNFFHTIEQLKEIESSLEKSLVEKNILLKNLKENVFNAFNEDLRILFFQKKVKFRVLPFIIQEGSYSRAQLDILIKNFKNHLQNYTLVESISNLEKTYSFQLESYLKECLKKVDKYSLFSAHTLLASMEQNIIFLKLVLVYLIASVQKDFWDDPFHQNKFDVFYMGYLNEINYLQKEVLNGIFQFEAGNKEITVKILILKDFFSVHHLIKKSVFAHKK